jgi:hypothetical protein
MKPKYLSPFFTLIVVLAMLLTAFVPAVAVSAASPSIELDDDSGEAGDTIEITGEDFTEDYHYYIFFDEEYLEKGSIDDDGEFTESITIPDDYDEDEDYIIAVFACEDSYSSPDFDVFDEDDDEYAEADFYLEESDEDIYIELDPDSGIAGDEIEVNGEGFTEDYYYFIFFDEDYLKKGSIDGDGEFSKTITIPDDVDPGETYEIEVFAREDSNSDPEYDDFDEDDDEYGEADFDIEEADAAIKSDSTSGNVGDTFTLSGSDFGKSKTITVYWDGTAIGSTFTSTSSGAFSGKTYIVPETYYGTHTVKVADALDISATLTYSVTPGIILSSISITGGNTITVNGSGFKASSNITFYIDSTVITSTAKTSASGTLSSTSVTVPTTVSAGSHIIKVQDASGYSASANITITAPTPTTSPTPTPTPTTTPTPTPTTTIEPTPTQTLTTTPVTTSSPAPTSTSTSSSGFPVWAIIVIIIMVIALVVVIAFIVRRKAQQ